MHQPRIKVFWDLESCPPPHSYGGSPWDLLKAIRLFIMRFGVVNSFKAYWDLSRSSTTNTESLRAVMPSMGINLVDCSLVKEYDRDALSRTLAVEILVSAIDDPTDFHSAEPNIIMIFSGDRSIIHPISLLTLRGYTVFLVVPDQSDYPASSRAARVFSWNTDVLDLKQERSLTSVSMLSMGPSSQPGSSATPIRANGTRRRFNASDHDAPPHLVSSPAIDTGFTFSTSSMKSPQIAAQQSSPPHMASPIAAPMSPSLFRVTASTPITPRTRPATIPTLSDPSGSRAPSVLSQDSTNQPSKFSSPFSVKPRESLSRSPEKYLSGLEQPKLEPTQQFEVVPTDDWGTNSGWNEGGVWEISSSDWSAKPGKQQQRLQEEMVAGIGLASTELNPILSPNFPSHMEMPLPESSPTDNTVFLPLLQCLQKARAEGKDQPLRSVIGAELSKYKDIYRVAGAPNFGGYVALAAQKGLVNLGGAGGKVWVSLK